MANLRGDGLRRRLAAHQGVAKVSNVRIHLSDTALRFLASFIEFLSHLEVGSVYLSLLNNIEAISVCFEMLCYEVIVRSFHDIHQCKDVVLCDIYKGVFLSSAFCVGGALIQAPHEYSKKSEHGSTVRLTYCLRKALVARQSGVLQTLLIEIGARLYIRAILFSLSMAG